MLLALILVAQLLSPGPSPSPSPAPSASPSAAPSVTPIATAAPLRTATPLAQPKRPLFAAPRGWSAVRMRNARPTLWSSQGAWVRRAGRNFYSFNVLSVPNPGLTLDDYVKVNVLQLRRMHGGMQLQQNRAIGLCNKTPGWEIEYRLGAMDVKQVFALNATRGYIASYFRSGLSPDDPAGLNALQSLCAPPDDAQTGSGPAPLTPPPGWHVLNSPALQKTNGAFDGWGFISPLHETHASVIMVVTMPTANALSLSSDQLESAIQTGMAKWASNINVVSKDTVTLCRAEGMHYRMTAFAFGYGMNIDAVVSAGSPTSYAAFYLRRSTDADEAPAETSIRTLCPADRQSAA